MTMSVFMIKSYCKLQLFIYKKLLMYGAKALLAIVLYTFTHDYVHLSCSRCVNF